MIFTLLSGVVPLSMLPSSSVSDPILVLKKSAKVLFPESEAPAMSIKRGGLIPFLDLYSD